VLSGGATNFLGFASCHTASPSTTGANEYAGVTRLAATWNAASGAAKTNLGTLSFTTSDASAVTDFGFWSPERLRLGPPSLMVPVAQN
jgi:hypothetical protein